MLACDMNKVTVVMALYKPNLKWLEEELLSIGKQTYTGFSVIAWNDCPQDDYDYEAFFAKFLPSIPFKIYSGEKNLGSNGVFAQLTELVQTPYIAYCDQDDIWCEDKLEVLLKTIETERDGELVFSDMMVVDENSKLVADSITNIRPRHKFYPGKGALEHLLAKNFVTGCTMIMKTKTAQAALPFPDSIFHDWWLAVYAAAVGRIVMVSKPLMKYRIHSENQSAVLSGINDKNSYYVRRVLTQYEFMKVVQARFGDKLCVQAAYQWCNARKEYFKKPNMFRAKQVLALGQNNLSTAYFEILLPFIPEIIFEKIIMAVKKGRL